MPTTVQKRRTMKLTYTGGVLSETRHFFYTDPARWQVLEERTATSTTAERQFIWGLRYIDDLVLRDRDTTGGGTLNERVYGLQDPNWNMLAVVDSSGTVQERYSYDAYGTVAFLTPAFAMRTASFFAWETLHAGYRRDVETALYPVRGRVLEPLFGWLQRDSIGLAGGVNLYEYVGSRPIVLTDPHGAIAIADDLLILVAIALVFVVIVAVNNMVIARNRDALNRVGNNIGNSMDELLGWCGISATAAHVITNPEGRCTFLMAWCLWGNNPENDPGKGWKARSPCVECKNECVSAGGIWSFVKCPMGSMGPRWRFGSEDSNLPPGWEWGAGEIPIRI